MKCNENEVLIPLCEAARAVPSAQGRKPHTSTLWRWCRKGVNGAKLEYVRVGRRIFTTKESLTRFYDSLTEQDKQLAPSRQNSGTGGPRSAKSRKRQVDTARRKLDAEGI